MCSREPSTFSVPTPRRVRGSISASMTHCLSIFRRTLDTTRVPSATSNRRFTTVPFISHDLTTTGILFRCSLRSPCGAVCTFPCLVPDHNTAFAVCPTHVVEPRLRSGSTDDPRPCLRAAHFAVQMRFGFLFKMALIGSNRTPSNSVFVCHYLSVNFLCTPEHCIFF